MANALSELAERGSVILCFDDAQWMDTPSIALLHGVAKTDALIGVLLAKRPEPPSTMEAAMLYGAPDVKTLELQPLGEEL
jgi:predicted ATPase